MKEIIGTKAKTIIIVELLVIICLLIANFFYYNKVDQSRLDSFKSSIVLKSEELADTKAKLRDAEKKLDRIRKTLSLSLDTYNDSHESKQTETVE